MILLARHPDEGGANMNFYLFKVLQNQLDKTL